MSDFYEWLAEITESKNRTETESPNVMTKTYFLVNQNIQPESAYALMEKKLIYITFSYKSINHMENEKLDANTFWPLIITDKL